ncbi:antibiotic biosynthesis monooxygenase [Ornithinimicrobium faecis]|uniref:Antibiotic biosynthesis monooxygenase n=1 Tax=Ornithinimicrobium faecis TaxID=2934158 RepID=A0ABY4YSZ1_9MICO|nr:antibiotic biosynthesis monooxygenase family protein [Ornithinimicrobium sp. HY1793]USQ79838.1 antibiotic biosynthesis monooxygenase [Ornithinimicrobium sp. HY1793]
MPGSTRQADIDHDRSTPVIIVAGHITVTPEERESYLAGCAGVVRQARGTAGCLDFAISADLIDPQRINIFERWASRETLEAFRGSGPDDGQGQAILTMAVEDFVVADPGSA